jgi:hypothetical protein
MNVQFIGDRGDWTKIDSGLVDKLNREAESEKKEAPKTPRKEKKTKLPESPQTENSSPLIVKANINPG